MIPSSSCVDYYLPNNVTANTCPSQDAFIAFSVIVLFVRVMATGCAFVMHRRLVAKRKQLRINDAGRFPIAFLLNVLTTVSMVISIILAGCRITDGPSGTSLAVFAIVIGSHFSSGVLFALKLAHINEKSTGGTKNRAVRILLFCSAPGVLGFLLCCFLAPSRAAFPAGPSAALQAALISHLIFCSFTMSAMILSCWVTVMAITYRINDSERYGGSINGELKRTIKRLYRTIAGFAMLWALAIAIVVTLLVALPLYWWVVMIIYLEVGLDDLTPFFSIWVKKDRQPHRAESPVKGKVLSATSATMQE